MNGRTSRGGPDVDARDKDAVKAAHAKTSDSRLFILAIVAESNFLRIRRFRTAAAPASHLHIIEPAVGAPPRSPGGAADAASKLTVRDARVENLDARRLQCADLRFRERRHLATGS